MTQRLYETDSFCREFDATVLACEPCENGYAVELDCTAFFPEGGGQAADTGRLNDTAVTDVRIRQGRILHMTAASLPVGESVHGCIDWQQRFRRMQKHSAEHVVCGLIHREYGLDNVGFHLGSEDVTLDLNGELTRQQLDRIEDMANQVVAENRLITAAFPLPEEAATLAYRSKKEVDGPLRIVTIDGVDICACCAPHVQSTGQIGVIKLLDCIRYKGGVRIHMQAGLDAVADYRMRYEQTAAVAAKLSVKQHDVSAAVDRLLGERDELKLAVRDACRRLAQWQVEAVEPTDRPVYLIGSDWDADTLRLIVNGLARRCGGLCGAFSGKEGVYQYVVGGHGDLPAFGKQMNAALNGRGGGSGEMIQGRVQADEEQIRDFWEQQM